MATSEFGKAFRAAREAGDKTFEFNGKKYTTDLASDKKPSPAEDDLEPGVRKARDLYTRSGKATVDRQDEEAAKDKMMSGYKPRKTDTYDMMANSPSSRGVRNMYERGAEESMGMKKGGKVVKMAKGGSVGSASKRGDGIAQKGKTKGRMC